MRGSFRRFVQSIVIRHSSFQEPPDQHENTSVSHPLGHLPHELVVAHSIKRLGKVHIHGYCIALLDVPEGLVDRIMGRPAGSVKPKLDSENVGSKISPRI